MTTNYDKKLMSLLSNHIPGTVFLASWLEKNGISRDLQQYYLKSGWLESYGVGAFKRPNENVRWTGALNSLQRQTELPVHVGGLTSISLQGLSHYVRMEKEPLYLFSPQYVKLPKWFLTQEWSNLIVHVKTKYLPANYALFEYSLDGLKLQISSLERAILECLYLAPDRFDMMECYQILEGLANLRPKILQELLESCNSIKVKRLFLFMASKARHQWLDFVDQPRIDLGTGDRVIVKGGVYISKYKISIPKELSA
ncbi:MAG: type IV toxin-antitoxin system AbiEi family antitoxin [Bacteroidales bacterium]|nr:type IV toxin-antitoxin system AbiEi family antitoxin [Bacteroidales bacterium]MCF8391076.1 type IV toxin-antitoxin system AbiEi family antitoxin [Bacteroidales bacterium]